MASWRSLSSTAMDGRLAPAGAAHPPSRGYAGHGCGRGNARALALLILAPRRGPMRRHSDRRAAGRSPPTLGALGHSPKAASRHVPPRASRRPATAEFALLELQRRYVVRVDAARELRPHRAYRPSAGLTLATRADGLTPASSSAAGRRLLGLGDETVAGVARHELGIDRWASICTPTAASAVQRRHAGARASPLDLDAIAADRAEPAFTSTSCDLLDS